MQPERNLNVYLQGSLKPFVWFCSVQVPAEFGFYNIKRLTQFKPERLLKQPFSIIVRPGLQTRPG